MSLQLDLDALNFDKGGGFVTVVAQDARTGTVLMVARSNREAFERTLATGEMHYHSRERGLWHKGATSGHTQRVLSLTPDCDSDAVLALVESAGPACHTGTASCFGAPRTFSGESPDALDALDSTIAQRIAGGASESSSSYTRKLASDRNLRLKKLGEEVVELAVALADEDRDRIIAETADVVYHLLVAARVAGVSLAQVRVELARRAAGAQK